MATVFIPPFLRDLTRDQSRVTAGGATVREVVEDLNRQFPGLRERVVQGDYFRSGQTVAVDDVAYTNRVAMYQHVGPDSEVHFITAIAGG